MTNVNQNDRRYIPAGDPRQLGKPKYPPIVDWAVGNDGKSWVSRNDGDDSRRAASPTFRVEMAQRQLTLAMDLLRKSLQFPAVGVDMTAVDEAVQRMRLAIAAAEYEGTPSTSGTQSTEVG